MIFKDINSPKSIDWFLNDCHIDLKWAYATKPC